MKIFWYNLFPASGFLAIILVVYWILYPGQFGPYILDDLSHFPKLEEGIYDRQSLYNWIFSTGESGSGRPLSYLSFLIDDNAWPNQPQDFKHTNILLHLLTGVLVFSFVRRLLLIAIPEFSVKKNEYLTLLLTLMWLVAPIHQSAIFMAIQRMTLLMGIFVFAGLNFYIIGRVRIHHRPLSGYSLISAGIGFFGLLGVFSKEPAVLICLYALVLEGTILKRIPWKDAYRRYWMIVFLFMPLLLIIVFYMVSLSSMEGLYAKRDFTMIQRLLTEPRVIADYVGSIIYPSSANVGPYFDDYVASKSLFSPLSTIIYCAAIVGFLFIAIKVRRTYSLISFGILFYLAGHVLESTFLPIELYFEHRNYIAMIGVCFALLGISKFLMSCSPFIKKCTVVSVISLLAFQTYSSVMTAKTWGNRNEQTVIWHHYHPHSLRAQLDSIKLWLDYGMVDKAQTETEGMLTEHPNSTGLHMFLKVLDLCKPEYNLSFYGKRELLPILSNGMFAQVVVESISFLRINRTNARCDISHETLTLYIEALLENENFRSAKGAVVTLYKELSHLYIQKGNYNNALAYLDKAYEVVPDYKIALRQAYLAMTAGSYSDAQILLDKSRRSPHINKYDYFWREEEIAAWENKLSNLIKAQ